MPSHRSETSTRVHDLKEISNELQEDACRFRRCRRNGAAANILSNGDLSLSEATKSVERGGVAYTLTKREYALLSALLARPGAILSRRALEDRIYAVGEEPDSNAVEYLIHALRKKLGADAVKNVRGLGWMVAGRDGKA